MRYCFNHHLKPLWGWTLCQLDLKLALEDRKQAHCLKPYPVSGSSSSSQAHRRPLHTALYGDNSPAFSVLSSRPHLNHVSQNHGSYSGVNSERSNLWYITSETFSVSAVSLLTNRALHFVTVKLFSHKDCCSPLYGCQVYLLDTDIYIFLTLLTILFLT